MFTDKATVQEYIEKAKTIVSEPLPDDIDDNYYLTNELFEKIKPELLLQDKTNGIGRYEFLMKLLGGGLREKEFSILCGATGKGKTTFLINVAVELMAQGTPIMVACVENGADDAMVKMISIISGMNISQGMSEKDRDIAYESSKAILSNFNSVIMKYDSRVSHLRFLADILYCHEKYGTKIVLVDNLNFMMDVKKGNDQLIEMDRTVHEFVVFCKKVPVHVIMVMHPKKTEHGRVESEFDIKGSSTAVQEASNVLLFNTVKEPEKVPLGISAHLTREITLAKIRKNGKHTGRKVFYTMDQVSERMSETRYE